MDFLILLPILVPFVTAILALFSWNQPRLQRAIGLLGTVLLLATAVALFVWTWQDGIHAMQVGGWPSPFGITMIVDLFSAVMVLLTALMGFTVGLYSVVNIDSERRALGFYPLYHILLMGVCGSFLTGDLFNLYVWFELMLIASFVLMALGSEKRQLEGAFKYVAINLVSSSIFLAAAGILYGVAGTLNMADLSAKIMTVSPGIANTLAMMFLIAFGIKAALVPLFSWMPAAYHTPPTAVSSIFAGLLTKVGVYAIIRIFTLIFVQDRAFTNSIILVLAGLTMFIGVLGAASQNHFRRILSFHITSQIGYMIMGLALFTPLALAGAIFYIIHHIIVKTNLFLISGFVDWIGGSYELKRLGGLYRSLPLLGLLFLIPALSLAGIPPLSGFWAKFTLIQAGLEAKQYAIVLVALLVSFLTLFSMTKIWIQVFWKDQPEADVIPLPTDNAGWIFRLVPITILVICTLLISFAAQPVFDVAQVAADQLLSQTDYINTVVVLSGAH